MNSVDRDIFILGLTAFAEASNQGQEGIRAQIHSVLNRHRVGKWYSGETVAECCFIPYAYSCWNSKDPNRRRAMIASPSDSILAVCLEEAGAALRGETTDPTGGATHYYWTGIVEPDWVSGVSRATGKSVAQPAQFTVQIGSHRFYKGVQ